MKRASLKKASIACGLLGVATFTVGYFVPAMRYTPFLLVGMGFTLACIVLDEIWRQI